MAQPLKETFRLSWRSPLVIALEGCVIVMLVLAWPHTDLLMRIGAIAGIGLAIALLLPAVSLSENEIVLYGLNRLPWSQIVDARVVSVMGLPYIAIDRQKGFRWWLPLYVSGSRPIGVALAAWAPPENPIRLCV
jgi:hypothetical protein